MFKYIAEKYNETNCIYRQKIYSKKFYVQKTKKKKMKRNKMLELIIKIDPSKFVCKYIKSK